MLIISELWAKSSITRVQCKKTIDYLQNISIKLRRSVVSIIEISKHWITMGILFKRITIIPDGQVTHHYIIQGDGQFLLFQTCCPYFDNFVINLKLRTWNKNTGKRKGMSGKIRNELLFIKNMCRLAINKLKLKLLVRLRFFRESLQIFYFIEIQLKNAI